MNLELIKQAKKVMVESDRGDPYISHGASQIAPYKKGVMYGGLAGVGIGAPSGIMIGNAAGLISKKHLGMASAIGAAVGGILGAGIGHSIAHQIGRENFMAKNDIEEVTHEPITTTSYTTDGPEYSETGGGSHYNIPSHLAKKHLPRKYN